RAPGTDLERKLQGLALRPRGRDKTHLCDQSVDARAPRDNPNCVAPGSGMGNGGESLAVERERHLCDPCTAYASDEGLTHAARPTKQLCPSGRDPRAQEARLRRRGQAEVQAKFDLARCELDVVLAWLWRRTDQGASRIQTNHGGAWLQRCEPVVTVVERSCG